MKRIILLAALVISGLTVSQSKTSSTKAINHFSMLVDTSWTKGANWTGMSQSKKYYYKINPKNQVIFSSVNTKTWSAVIGGMWMSKDGKWMKIADKKLVWSADAGKTWSAVPDETWQDADGDWCKFDADWNLWIKKGA